MKEWLYVAVFAAYCAGNAAFEIWRYYKWKRS
jgi:hypothetical protein